MPCRRPLTALLLLTAAAAAQPFPPMPVPGGNPITADKVVLGKILFWDEQLSSDNTMACGTCHRPEWGGSDPRLGLHPGFDTVFGTADDVVGSPGVRRSDANGEYADDPLFGHAVQVTGRASPTMIGTAWNLRLFWDGRAGHRFIDPETGAVSLPWNATLESQAVGPPLSSSEMAHDGRGFAAISAKLAAVDPLKLASNWPADVQSALGGGTTYPDLFRNAFGDPTISGARIAKALASYQRTLVPDQAPIDDYLAGNSNALTPRQQTGRQVFLFEGNCGFCHFEPLYTDDDFHNIGLRPAHEDLGRFDVTGDPADRGAFKTPTLRNVGLKPTYMHDGRFTTLRQVVAFYARGGDFSDNLDPVIGPLAIPPSRQDALVDFLQNGLTDPRVAQGLPPFDRPTLYSERQPAGSTSYRLGSAGTGGFVPEVIADQPATLDDPSFRVGIHRALGGAPAWFVVAAAPTAPGTTLGGLPIHVDLSLPPVVFPLLLAGSGPGQGFGTLSTTIPKSPVLANVRLFGQWVVQDSGVPAGYAVSPGAWFDTY